MKTLRAFFYQGMILILLLLWVLTRANGGSLEDRGREAPQVSVPTLTNNVVDENLPAGTVVGDLATEGFNPVFTIAGVIPAVPPAFEILGNQLITQRVLNAEAVATYNIVIVATSGFPFRESASNTFEITVQNQPEPPTGLLLSSVAVAEGTPAGTVVSTISAIGGTPEVPPTFALIDGAGGEDNAKFSVQGNQLVILEAPNFERQPQYRLLMQAVSDGASPPQPINFNVTNVAEPPTNITLSSNKVAENQPESTLVGEFAVEGGASVAITYSLSGADAASFAVNRNRLLTRAPLNFEARVNYALTVTATGDGAVSQDFAIEVTDVPEPPTDLALGNNEINEGEPVGTVVGKLMASGGAPATAFALVDGRGSRDNESFTIEGDLLRTQEIFDFEQKAEYAIRVRATGDGALEKRLTVVVVDQADPPNDIALSASTVAENQPAGTPIGRLSASGGSGPYEFSLPQGEGNNGRFSLQGDELVTDRVLDFEKSATRTAVVRVRNGDGRFDKSFTIDVTNVSEPPTDITLSNATVAENQEAGTTVGTLSATGGDGPVTFRLADGGDNDFFTIEGSQLKTARPLNFENKRTFNVQVQAQGDGNFSKTFAITVTNVPEPPTAITLSPNTVSENQPAGTLIGNLSAVGGVGSITFTLVGEGNGFRVEGRQLLTNTTFNYEERGSYAVRIRASGDGAFSEVLTVRIEDIDEPPVLRGVESTFLEYAEGDDAKLIANNITISDPDSEVLTQGVVSFAAGTYVPGEDELILGQNGVPFEWNANQGRLVVKGPLPLNQMRRALGSIRYRNLKDINPTSSTRRVIFQVSDNTGNSNQQERFIRVSNSNVPPVLSTVNLSTGEDQPITISRDSFADAYGGDEDGDGFPGTIFITALPGQGTLSFGNRLITDDDIARPGFEVNFQQDLVYTPQIDFSGTDRFLWTVIDNQGEAGIAAEANVNIVPANDAPLIDVPSSINVEEDTEDPLSGIAVSDADNDFLQISLSVDEGTLTIREAVRSEFTLITGTGVDDTELSFESRPGGVNELLTNLVYTSTTNGTLRISVRDVPADAGAALTAEASVNLVIIPQNDDPILSELTPEALIYTENGPPLPIADSLRVTDEENDDIIAAVVAIDSGATPDDLLVFEDTESIQATLTEGVLTLTGPASPADYQQALRSITFENVSDQPAATPRTLSVAVTDATGGRSNTLTRELIVVPVEDTLRLDNLEERPLYFVIGDRPVPVSRTIQLVDPDSDVVDRLVVSLDNVTAADSLGVAPGENIRAVWDEAQGTLTLSGQASVAAYQQILRTLVYRYRGNDENSRTLRIQGFSGETSSNIVAREVIVIQNTPPVVSDFSLSVNNGSFSFSTDLFQTYYQDQDNQPVDGADLLQITSLPQQGTLLFDDTPLTLRDIQEGFFMAVSDAAQLSYVSNQGFVGEDGFTWNASDGAQFAAEPARVLLNVFDLGISVREAEEGCSQILRATIVGGSLPYQYRWSSEQAEALSDSSVAMVEPVSPTVYVITITDAAGIVISDSVEVGVLDCTEQVLDIRTAFTPNGDTKNDVWEIGNLGSGDTVEVEIYDRFGHRLFRSEGYTQPWDGTYEGKALPTGTYFYVISLSEGSTSYKGSVTILR